MGFAFSRVLLSPFSSTTGWSVMTSWPTLETPSEDATRNSRTPGRTSSPTVTFSVTWRTIASPFPVDGTTSALTPSASNIALYAPAKFIWPATVTVEVLPRSTATGETWVIIGYDVWALATVARRSVRKRGRMGWVPGVGSLAESGCRDGFAAQRLHDEVGLAQRLPHVVGRQRLAGHDPSCLRHQAVRGVGVTVRCHRQPLAGRQAQ